MNRQTPRIGMGAVSLVVILSALCLTIFSLLTLVTALNDRSLADQAALTTQEYYEADVRAMHIRRAVEQAVQDGNLPAKVGDITLEHTDDEVHYICPVGDTLQLVVRLSLAPDGSTGVREWRTEPAGDWQADTSIEVWDGEGA
ncbi:MAG: hypothetical protein AB7C89_02475 [Intestinibacillus sp.]